MPDTDVDIEATAAHLRLDLADELAADGSLLTAQWRAAVQDVPRHLFLPCFFTAEPTPDGSTSYTPVGRTPDTGKWLDLAYRNTTWVTQLDGHLTADTAPGPVTGIPTSSSTLPSLVVSMLEALDVSDGMNVLEIGTGTGYSTALLCNRLGEDQVTSIEVDPAIAARADAALESAGYSTWTVTGDGLVGHPYRAPYDRVIATMAVRRIPHAWIRQTRPGGIVLATVGSWAYGTGLAKLTVGDDGTAQGSIIAQSSFMPARSQAPVQPSGDLFARAAYPDSERKAVIAPGLLQEWMPAFLAQLAAPGTHLIRTALADGTPTVYLLDLVRESFAALTADGEHWTVRQGGPVALWDAVEDAITAWQGIGQPDITAVHLRVDSRGHEYWIEGDPRLRWAHRV